MSTSNYYDELGLLRFNQQPKFISRSQIEDQFNIFKKNRSDPNYDDKYQKFLINLSKLI